MGACPFCTGDINDDTLVNGGRCPLCFIEIPGEESPTDPGLDRREQQEAEDQARTRRSNRGPLVAVGAVVAMAVVGGGFFLLSQPKEEPMPEMSVNLDEMYVVPLSEHRDVELPGDPSATNAGSDEAEEQLSDSQRARREERRARRRSSTGGTVEAEDTELAEGSLVDPMSAFSTPLTGPRSRGPEAIVLSNTAQIEKMVRSVVKRGQKQLQQCYETQLKTNEAFSGEWWVYFMLREDGSPAGVRVRATSTRNSEFESCLKRNVEKWRFQAIEEAMEISYPFSFGKH